MTDVPSNVCFVTFLLWASQTLIHYAEKRKRDVTSWEHQLCVGYLNIKFRTVILNKSPNESLDYKNNPCSNWNNTLRRTEKSQNLQHSDKHCCQ